MAPVERADNDGGSSDVRGDDQDATEGIEIAKGLMELAKEKVTTMDGSRHAMREGVALWLSRQGVVW